MIVDRDLASTDLYMTRLQKCDVALPLRTACSDEDQFDRTDAHSARDRDLLGVTLIFYFSQMSVDHLEL